MRNQALFSSKDKSKKLKCRLLQFLFGALGLTNTSNKKGNCALMSFIKLLAAFKGSNYCLMWE